MNNVLTICPSRNRPDRLQEMLDSFHRTSSISDIIVYVSNDDPRLEEYRKIKENIFTGYRKHISEVYNFITEVFDYDFYHIIDDDMVYHTKEWDKKLIAPIKDFGISCGGKEGLPAGVVISGNIVKALGYMITPLLHHTYIDNYLEELGQAIKRFYRVPEVYIEHKHWLYGKGKLDDNYKWVTSTDEMNYGKSALDTWRVSHLKNDVEKILNACRSVN